MSRILTLILWALLLPASVFAQNTHIPDELLDWRDWVLDGKEYRDCPLLFNRSAQQPNDFVCAWPGQLSLTVTASGGRFAQGWTVHAGEQWIPLPGDANYWPDRVTVNDRPVEVVLRQNVPSVYLGAGNYRITGAYAWDERPGNLRIPWQSGLIALNVDGRVVERPARNNGNLFLGERREATQARDSITSNVYRLVADDVPTRLTTRLDVQVSGGVREALFGPLLPDGFVPLAIDSDLPARLEPDGMLRVQVRPGRWVIGLTARGAAVLDSISMPAPESNMADTEIWSYASNAALRVTAPEGLPPVDPMQAGVPHEWTGLPAFRITPGEALSISERSRGIVSADNDLALSRTMWLNFDRSGFIVADRINGTMRSDWRLDMAAPFTLLTASVYGDNLLITTGENEGETGVELRHPDLDLESVAETAATGSLPATGWESRFNSAAATLHLPPGHKLLAAPGVDQVRDSWASQWDLLDFFLVMVIGVATWRLFGARAGVIALAALVLSFHETQAPAWLWLNILVAVALLRVAPAGKLRQSVRVYQLASAALLVLTLVPFIAGQLRIAIYPQLETQRHVYPMTQEADRFDTQPEVPAAAPGRARDQSALMAQKRLSSEFSERESLAVEEIVVTGANLLSGGASYSRYAPNAIVQAGAGIPSWQWNTYRLDWSGPVDSAQSMRLVILPRWLVSALRIVEVALLLLFVAVLAAEILQRPIKLPGGLRFGNAASAMLAAFLVSGLLLSPGQPAQAQTPDAEILKELENRLLRPPDCAPHCAEIVAADIDIAANSVRMALTIHTLEDVAVPLPGSDSGWRPVGILTNGTAANQVARGPDQALWIRLPAGQHSIEMRGPIPAVDSLEIPFPTPPRVVTVDGEGWFIAGIKDRRLLSGSLQLTRLQSAQGGDGGVRWESSRFPPFVKVTRTVQLDLDWAVNTVVERIAPAQGALTLELPLIDGESVVVENMTVEDGKILVSMAPNQSHVSWRSNLERKSSLALTAAQNMPWTEVWRVVVGHIWHAEFSGVPESESGGGGNGRVATFNPRGGETLGIDATRPEGTEGSTLAFDAVHLRAVHGDRSSDATLSLDYRATRGAQHVIQLPPDAEVSGVVIDGERQPLRAEQGKLTLPILPGEHRIEISWRSDVGVAARVTTPAVDIAAPAGNISLRLELPRDRWLLATRGPRLGPAVLYWSELAVLILAAIILGRTALAPLKTWQWLLLGLGFSTFNWPALGLVVFWLLAAGARERWKGETSWWRFNLVQLVFAGLTIVALGTIVSSLPSGLLGVPDMSVTGNDSYGNSLQWFADQSESVLPTASAWSVPLWIYKGLILGWALWLSFALLRWLPWVWRSFSSQGYWRPRKQSLAKLPENSE